MSKKILEYSSYIANAIIITLLVVIIGKNNEIRKVKEDYFVEQVVKYKRLAYDRYNYASDLEEICEKYFSSSVEKENYHIRKAQDEFVNGYNN